jgi:hypothetical protein
MTNISWTQGGLRKWHYDIPSGSTQSWWPPKIVVEGFIMSKIQSLANMPKNLLILLKFHKLLFLLHKWILKSKIIILHQSVEPKKPLW